ncbi:MAG TPA: hypothetical protein VMU96_02445 [Casimicrobiaceae bacterium]|nr:hypothetical protein [Casimicrobiaceae bacterium]
MDDLDSARGAEVSLAAAIAADKWKGPQRGPFRFGAARRRAVQKALGLLDLLEHLEDTLRRTDKKALVRLAEATTL